MTSPTTSSTESTSTLDDVIDLGPGTDDIRAVVPVPADAGTPNHTRFNLSPAHTWPVMDSEGQLVGYLCLYPTSTKQQAVLRVYGESPIRRRDWRDKRAPALERAIAEHNLEKRERVIIVIAPHSQEVSKAVLSELDGDYVIVRATISFGAAEGPQVKTEPLSCPTVALKGSSQTAPPEGQTTCAVYRHAERSASREPVQPAEPAIPAIEKVQGSPPLVAETPSTASDMTRGAERSCRGIVHTAVASMATDPDIEAPEIPMIRAADLVPETLAYIWKGRIACGKLTMVVGEPGLGKSLLAAHLAATVSQGAAWASGENPAPRGSVILVTTEDDLNDTVRPRLEAAGADLNAVHLRSDLDLTRDFEAFERRVSRIPDVRLIIIDPITSCCGRANLNGTAEVRAVLSPLTRFAARTGTAVVFITHPNKKSSGRALNRASGSHAFVAVARSAFSLSEDKNDPGRRLLLPIKNNLGVAGQGVAFRIEEVAIGIGAAPRLVFDSEPVTITADEALNGSYHDSSRRSAVDEAKEFLLDFLAADAVPVPDVQAAARAAGITLASLRRAKDALGIKPKKSGMEGKWLWMLPPSAKMINPAEGAQVEQMSTFAEDEHLRVDGEIASSTTDAKGARA